MVSAKQFAAIALALVAYLSWAMGLASLTDLAADVLTYIVGPFLVVGYGLRKYLTAPREWTLGRAARRGLAWAAGALGFVASFVATTSVLHSSIAAALSPEIFAAVWFLGGLALLGAVWLWPTQHRRGAARLASQAAQFAPLVLTWSVLSPNFGAWAGRQTAPLAAVIFAMIGSLVVLEIVKKQERQAHPELPRAPSHA